MLGRYGRECLRVVLETAAHLAAWAVVAGSIVMLIRLPTRRVPYDNLANHYRARITGKPESAGIAWKQHWSNFPHRDFAGVCKISFDFQPTQENCREERGTTTALCASWQFDLDQYNVDYFAANPSHSQEKREAFQNINNSRYQVDHDAVQSSDHYENQMKLTAINLVNAVTVHMGSWYGTSPVTQPFR